MPQSHEYKERPHRKRRRGSDQPLAVSPEDVKSTHKIPYTANGSKRMAPALMDYYRQVDCSVFLQRFSGRNPSRSCGARRQRNHKNHAGSQILPHPPPMFYPFLFSYTSYTYEARLE